MIDRYSREEIKNIWELNSKFDYYLRVELAVCEAYAKLGVIPPEILKEIKNGDKILAKIINIIEWKLCSSQ